MELPPGPASSPRLFSQWMRHPDALLDDCLARYGDPFTLRLYGLPPMVILSDPESVKDLFKGDPGVLLSGQANSAMQAVLGTDSLLLLDRDEHLHERRLMLPPFHGERMRAYGDLIAGVAERSMAGWPVGRAFAVSPHARAMALEVIMRAVFGVEERGRLERLGRALRSLLDVAVKPNRVVILFLMKPGGPTMRAWRRWSPRMRTVDRLLHEEIRRRRADPGEDILSMLIEARDSDGRPLSDEHLRNELMTLLLAGHETTAIGLSWALLQFARDPEAAARAAADDEFLDAAIKETLRLHPVFGFSALRDTVAPVEVGGRTYPEGVRLVVCSHLIHRRPELYPDPLVFRPERFLEQPGGTYTLVPFGGGRRRCLGASFAMFELRTILQVVLRGHELRAPDAEPEPVKWRGLGLAPARGARIVLEPRQPSATARPPRSAAV